MTTIQQRKMTTQKERHEERITNILQGIARSPYKHTPIFNSEDQCTCDSSDVDVCAQCRPVLVRYADPFKTMVHQGTALKKRKRTNPNPKRSGSIPYRDVKQQNEWLQSNVFDSMGNYLYYCACICAAFGISKQRLARQRKIKRQQSQHPIVEMFKAQVEDELLGKYVIMPDSEELSFKTWWHSLPESTGYCEIATCRTWKCWQTIQFSKKACTRGLPCICGCKLRG